MKNKTIFSSIIVVVIILLTNIGVFGQQKGNIIIENTVQLQPPKVQPMPLGLAKISFAVNENDRTTEQKFQVVGIRLIAGATYTLVVDGKLIDTLESSKDTTCVVEFTYTSKKTIAKDGVKYMPRTIRPLTNLKHIEIQDSQGQVVLQGDFQ